MLNLFGKNVFARKRKAKVMPIDSVSRIETLEERVVLAGQVAALYSNGTLTLTGSGDVDDLTITITGTNQVSLTGNGGTTLTGATGPFNVTGDLIVSLGNGADVLTVTGAAVGTLDSGNLLIDLGSGNDTMTTSGALTFTGNVSVAGGTGVDSITLGGAAAVSVFDLSIDSGVDLTAANNNKTIALSNVTAHNVTLVNGGTGAQLVTLGATANTFTGNLKISQTGVGATSHTVTAGATAVTGNVTISNANALTNVVGWTSSNVGGTTTIVNGNATTTLNSVTITTSTLSGSVTVKNGSANTTNAITVSGSSLNGRNSSFTNTSAVTSNTITFGLTTPSIFNGVVAATNGPATGGANLISVLQANLNAGGSLVNGTATTTNTVTVGSVNNVNVTGNLVIANGNATTSNNVNVDRLATGGTKAGDVTISNGTPGLTSGASTVTFGAAGLNTLGGNLTIRNQATTGTKTTTIGGTTVGGTTGFYLFNVGTGNSVTGIGQSNPTTVTNLFKIQDGSGTANLEIRAATLGGLNFEDLGGGIDTINIGTTATGTATVNGVTRIVTNGGSDIVNIGTVAPGAVFNDSVFISLGAGNDTLNVGAFAASPAFSTANKFQFDGASGVDTISVSPLSIADYELPFPGKKLRFKITNFENLFPI